MVLGSAQMAKVLGRSPGNERSSLQHKQVPGLPDPREIFQMEPRKRHLKGMRGGARLKALRKLLLAYYNRYLVGCSISLVVQSRYSNPSSLTPSQSTFFLASCFSFEIS